jgi:hypothetical protein
MVGIDEWVGLKPCFRGCVGDYPSIKILLKETHWRRDYMGRDGLITVEWFWQGGYAGDKSQKLLVLLSL